jgi:hypothetical protein
MWQNNSEEFDIWKHAKPPYWSLPMTIILSVTIIIVLSLAILGNFLVVLVIAKHRGMRTRTNMFLCNLAITDMLCGVINMPVSLVTVLRGQWVFGAPDGAFCQFNGFTMPLLFVASIHTLMYISLHKYISITRPFSRIITYRRIFILIALAWFWAFLSGYVTVHGLSRVRYKPYTAQCGPDYPHDLRSYMLPVYISVTCYLVPFVIMIFCYARVFSEIRAHSLRLEKHTNQEKDTIFLQQRRITVTLLLVLVIFVLTWTPYIIYSVYASMIKDKTKINHNFNAISYWFGYLNSACNPIIYALRSPAFREGYKEIMCRTQALITSEDPGFTAKLHFLLFRMCSLYLSPFACWL